MRIAAGIVAGVVAWMIGFYAIGIAFGLVWPAYAEAASHMFAEEDFSYFTLPMLLLNWALFIGTGLFAGLVAARIGKSRTAPLVLAGLWLLYGVVNHYWLVWNKLPDWYNVIVPFVIAAPIFVWSRLGWDAKRSSAAGG
jgi:hypothetical protein